MKKFIVLGSVIIGALVASIGCGENQAKESPQQAINQDSLIKRGKYLVTIGGCNDCHTPKVMGPLGPQLDTANLLSGHPAAMPLAKVNPAELQNWVLFNMTQTATVGPWGASFAANLSSDETGIGNWTESQFITALKKGKYKGLEAGRPLLPPMPWQNFVDADDDDLRAMFAYLKSTKPVKNIVPAPIAPGDLGK